MTEEKSDTIGPFFLVGASQRQLTIMNRIEPLLNEVVINDQ